MAIPQTNGVPTHSHARLLEVSSYGSPKGQTRRLTSERHRGQWPTCDCGETISTDGPECPPAVPRWADLPTSFANHLRQHRQNDIAPMVRVPNNGCRWFPSPD